jgi:hypothetical protein
VANPWAAKSAKDDPDDAAVISARRSHYVLHATFVLPGLVAGFLLWKATDRTAPLVCAFYMVMLGFISGEIGNAVWLLLCRYRLRLTAAQVRAALDGSYIHSLVLNLLRERLFPR